MAEMKIVEDNHPLKAYLVAIQTPDIDERENHASLDELSRLVKTLGHEVIGRLWQKRPSTQKDTVLGEGKLRELATLTGGPGTQPTTEGNDKDLHPRDDQADFVVDAGSDADGKSRVDLVVFDCDLSPSQLRNLEEALGVRVLDRTGVIIEIFSRHARSRAARLQIEIARLSYLAPRLRETGGGHMDRQGGKGSGETAIELDRRKIRDRIAELRREFASIGREDETRRARRNETMRSVAIVGYTNAGKSSLMRTLTRGEHYVADKLFATLDTTVRQLAPPSKPPILLSDTVGFIKKLPHDLVASFKSTLDEATHADLLLHLVDASDPAFRSQIEVTRSVLSEIDANSVPTLLIFNKRDQVSAEETENLRQEFPDVIWISTRRAEDVQCLRDRIIDFFTAQMIEGEINVPYAAGWAIGEIRDNYQILTESYDVSGIVFKVKSTSAEIEQLKGRLDKERKPEH